MAQYKKIEVSLTVKKSAFSGGAQDKIAYPTREVTYTETISAASCKSVQDGLVADVMATLVEFQQMTRFDENTGVRIKVTYSTHVRIAGSVSAAGMSKETGEKAIKRGTSRSAKKRAKRAAAKARAAAKKQAA